MRHNRMLILRDTLHHLPRQRREDLDQARRSHIPCRVNRLRGGDQPCISIHGQTSVTDRYIVVVGKDEDGSCERSGGVGFVDLVLPWPGRGVSLERLGAVPEVVFAEGAFQSGYYDAVVVYLLDVAY